MSEMVSGPAIQSGTAAGLMEFTNWVVAKGYGTAAAWTPLRSAARQVFVTVDGPEFGDVDVRELDLDNYLERYETKARGHIKTESIHSYKSRFTRTVEAYRHFLDTGQPPRAGTRRASSDARPSAPKKSRASTTSGVAPTGDEQAPGARLIDYPFPLRSGQIALLRLPVRLERTDAERMAAFVKTLVVEPQGDEPAARLRGDAG